jgi:nucleotide-binding universal stress UspA family protein
VVIAFDGSGHAAHAIEQAGALLGAREAHVLTAWEALSPVVAPVALPEVEEALRRDAEALVEDGAAKAAAAGFDVAGQAVRQSQPAWHAAIELAEEVDAEAIVVGARGRSRLAAMLLGSFSTGVVNNAPCPVLVVHDARGAGGPGGPVLLCYDGSEGAKRAGATAARLFPSRAAVALHVWEPLSAVASVPPVPGLGGVLREGLAEMDQIGLEESARLAAEGAREAEEAGLRAEALSEQREGRAWRAILAIARERDAAVVVVGRRGVGTVERTLMGSISSAVVQRADRPVLVVP